MADTKTENTASFQWGTAFQVGGFSRNNSQFRLRTLARGYFLEKAEKILGTGNCLMVREFKVVWNNKTISPSFRLISTSKEVKMAKEYMQSYFEEKCSGDYFSNVDKDDILNYEEQLSCRKASWFSMNNNSNERDLDSYLKRACIAIFSTEDREGEYYFEEEVKVLVDKLLDASYTKDQNNRDTLFGEFYEVEKKIDRMRRKKGASKRLITKMCSLITLVLTETEIKGDESVDFAKPDKTPFSTKEIAKLAFNVAINDITVMTHIINVDKEAVEDTDSVTPITTAMENISVTDD